MSFSKVIQIGDVGSLSLSEAAGIASVKISVAKSIDGDLVKAVASAEVDVSAAALAQLSLDFIKSKLPESMQPLVTALEAVAIPALSNL